MALATVSAVVFGVCRVEAVLLPADTGLGDMGRTVSLQMRRDNTKLSCVTKRSG